MKRWMYIILFYCLPISIGAQKIIDENVLANAILIVEEEINTSSFEYSPVFFGDFIGFVNVRGIYSGFDKENNTPFFDLAFAGANTKGNLARKASFEDVLSSEMQEGPFTFFNNGKSMLFTRTDVETGKLKIFKARNAAGAWKIEGQLYLLENDIHVCHPDVTRDGNTMLFAAAEDDQMDLYMAQSSSSGTWDEVVKLPAYIQSEGNDWFPRMVGDSIILFASDRSGGYGGLDIYATKNVSGEWTNPYLLPPPINSPADDMGLIIGNGIAYFSSNRNGGIGKDDLYRIEFKGDLIFNPAKEFIDINITVQDKLTLEPLNGVSVQLLPTLTNLEDLDLSSFQIDLISGDGEEGEVLLKLTPKGAKPVGAGTTLENGATTVQVKRNNRYLIKLSKEGFAPFSFLYRMEEYGRDINLVMEPIAKVEENDEDSFIPTTKGSVVVFENIYYDYDSHIIQEGAAQELDALAKVMLENPGMKVELSAHTDSRGTRIYNQQLSEKRAGSARQYLMRRGVNAKRIIAVGYGESKLRNRCVDDVSCSEEEHRFNRRTEVRILEN